MAESCVYDDDGCRLGVCGVEDEDEDGFRCGFGGLEGYSGYCNVVGLGRDRGSRGGRGRGRGGEVGRGRGRGRERARRRGGREMDEDEDGDVHGWGFVVVAGWCILSTDEVLFSLR